MEVEMAVTNGNEERFVFPVPAGNPRPDCTQNQPQSEF
jgi:hypothetical protein